MRSSPASASSLLLMGTLVLLSACDFATGSRCRSDDNCPDAAPVCGAFDDDGVGTCALSHPAVDAGSEDAGLVDAGPVDAGGGDAGAEADAGEVDGGAESDGGEIDGGPDAGPDPCAPVEPAPDAGPYLFGRIEFPLHPVTTDEDTFLVRVAAPDPTRACAVQVDGVPATHEPAANGHYLARVPLALGENTFDVTVSGFGASVDGSAGVVVTRVPFLPSDPRGAALARHDAEDILVAVDHPGVVIGMYVTGARAGEIVKLSGDGLGEGEPMSALNAIAASPDGLAVYALNSAALYRIDLATGDREVIAQPGDDRGPWETTLLTLAVSEDGNTAYVYDGVQTLFAVDLADDGHPRTVAASTAAGGGSGPSLELLSGVCAAGGRLYALRQDPFGAQLELISIDVDTNTRAVVSGAVEAGPTIPAPGPIACRGDTVLVASGDGSLFSVQLVDGARTLVSSAADPTLGPTPRTVLGIAGAGADDTAWITDEEREGFIEVDLSTGTRTLRSVRVSSGPRLHLPHGIVYLGNDGFVVVDADRRVLSIDATGARALLSDDSMHADGFSYGDLREMTRYNGGVLVTDATNKAVWELNLDTGDRAVFSAGSSSPLSGAITAGTGVDMSAVDDVAVSSDGVVFITDDVDNVVYRRALDGERALFNFAGFAGGPLDLSGGIVADELASPFVFLGDALGVRVLSMNPTSGMLAILAADGVGAGDDLYLPRDMAISNQEALYVLTGLHEDIIEVTLATGQRRSVVFGSYNPRGPYFSGGRSITTDGHWGFVTSAGRNAVMLVDLVTGERAVFSQ